MLVLAMDYIDHPRRFATTIRDEIEAGDRHPDDEVYARALESCARVIAGVVAAFGVAPNGQERAG